MTHDVIVVGAGPGGASAALRLAGAGVKDVLLLDGATFPRDKTCGSGLSPTALALGDELGVGEELRSKATPIASVKIVAPGGRHFVIASNAAAVVLLRREFDDMLVRRAQTKGAQLQGGVRARQLLREGGRVVGVRMADGRELRARYVLCADGAHSIFSADPRPKRSISTLMGWWDGADFTPQQIEMIFDRNVSPLYGWLFPESDRRVNIGICIDGQDANGQKTQRNVRDVFRRFLDDHYGSRLSRATQVGAFKGHPIVYTTWVGHCVAPGALYLGEAARVTHNATGEGISHAMQSGIYAADAVADVLAGRASEEEAWKAYVWKHRKRFTLGFVAGHALRAVVSSGALDAIARVYDNPTIRRGVVRTLGSALAGSSVHEAPLPGAPEAPRPERRQLIRPWLVRAPRACEKSRMQVIVDFCVVPMGAGVSVSAHVAECQRVLKQSGFEPHLHPYGTVIEGEWDEVFAALARCHEAVHAMGVARISTSIRCGTRTDRTQTIQDKLDSVREKLA